MLAQSYTVKQRALYYKIKNLDKSERKMFQTLLVKLSTTLLRICLLHSQNDDSSSDGKIFNFFQQQKLFSDSNRKCNTVLLLLLLYIQKQTFFFC